MVKTLTLALFLALVTAGIIACASNVDSPSLSPAVSPATTSVTTPLETSTPSQTPAVSQQLIIDDVMTDLKQQGVPVNSARLVSSTDFNPPMVIEFTLQSASNDTKSTPEDAINTHLVYRTANLAQRRGLNIGGIGITLINNQGKELTHSISATTRIDSLPSLVNTPSAVDDATVSALLKQKVYLSAPSTINIKVTQGIDGLREAIFDIQVQDIQTANNNMSIISSIGLTIRDLNLYQNAQISAYRINITDATGKPLLKLMKDLTADGGHTTWWEAEGLENWGYPSPPTAITTQN